jgi:hypothetical protein
MRNAVAIGITALLGCALALAIQLSRHLNHDVAYMTWVAEQVSRGAVFGIDIRELNPPLAFIIYWPAVWLAELFGFDLAVKLSLVALFLASTAVLSRTAPARFLLPSIATLSAFFALGFPREFGQREQIAVLLMAPYVAGYARSAKWNVASGFMAGLGACIKPHFLIVPLLLLAWRRKIGAAEWALAFAGLLYAATLVIFFRPYLTEMLPIAKATYAGIHVQSYGPVRALILFAYLAMASAVGLMAKDREAWGFGLAAFGFELAAILQAKLFAYHFLPAWAFLFLFLAALSSSTTLRIRVAALLVMLAAALQMYEVAVPWFRDVERREETIPQLLQVIDRSRDFLVLSDYPYPAFPTALYAEKPYLGVAGADGAVAAVGMLETGQDRSINPAVRQLAIQQAVKELSRRPDLVIVNDNWWGFPGLTTHFDGLAWLDLQPAFHRLWQHYRPAGRVAGYRLFRLVDTEVPEVH